MNRYRLGVTVIVWAVLVVALTASDAEPQVLVLGGMIGVVAATGFVAVDLIRAGGAVPWARAPRPYAVTSRDEAVSTLVRQIRGAERAPSSMLRDTLIDVVDARLLDRYGIERVNQPEAARAVLTPGLRRLGEQRRLRLSSLAELDALLTEIDTT